MSRDDRQKLVANFFSPAALLRFYGVCVVGLAIDLATKHWAQVKLGPSDFVEFPTGVGDKYAFLQGWVHFDWVFNEGAVFGIAAGYRGVFVAVSILALGFLTFLFATSKKQWGYQIILGMLLAGVLGNLYDRIVFGGVRDMIHALPGWTWPRSTKEVFPYVFNVADVLLCVGVFLMLVHALVVDFVAKPKAPPAAAFEVSEQPPQA